MKEHSLGNMGKKVSDRVLKDLYGLVKNQQVLDIVSEEVVTTVEE